MRNRSAALGTILFRYRSILPLPPIVFCLVFFHPWNFGAATPLLPWLGLAISLSGEAVRIYTVGHSFLGTSGRESFLRADQLNTSGLYSVLRNPLYWGNYLIFSGLLIAFGNPIAAFLCIAFLILEYRFITRAEESFLTEQYGAHYLNYCRRISRWRPRFRNWLPPKAPFQPLKVLDKENDSLFNIAASFLIILAIRENRFLGRIAHTDTYLIPGGAILITYIIIKIGKKHRRRLQEYDNPNL